MISVRCRFCDVLLVGREQFIGHMIHSHELGYAQTEGAWFSLASDDFMDVAKAREREKDKMSGMRNRCIEGL